MLRRSKRLSEQRVELRCGLNPSPKRKTPASQTQKSHPTSSRRACGRPSRISRTATLPANYDVVTTPPTPIWEQQARDFLDLLKAQKYCKPFLHPLVPDSESPEFHEYSSLVSQPLDLSVVEARLAAGNYSHSAVAFVNDIRQSFSNGLLFFPLNSPNYKRAEKMQDFVQQTLDQFFPHLPTKSGALRIPSNPSIAEASPFAHGADEVLFHRHSSSLKRRAAPLVVSPSELHKKRKEKEVGCPLSSAVHHSLAAVDDFEDAKTEPYDPADAEDEDYSPSQSASYSESSDSSEKMGDDIEVESDSKTPVALSECSPASPASSSARPLEEAESTFRITGHKEMMLSRGSLRLSAAGCSAKGWAKRINQDALSIQTAFKDLCMLSVCDGHGNVGEIAANLTCDLLPAHIAAERQSGKPIAEAMTIAVRKTNELLLKLIAVEEKLVVSAGLCAAQRLADELHFDRSHALKYVKSISKFDYGTTALAVALEGTTLTVANVGDCRCLLVTPKGRNGERRDVSSSTNGPSHVEVVSSRHSATFVVDQITRDQNPSSCPDEVARIRREGGEVSDVKGDARVHPKELEVKDAMQMGLNLNLSRSLGHPYLSKAGVSPVPELSSRSLDSVTEAFVILGCDGIFNALSNEDVARFVLEASSMETACEGAVEAADKVYQNKDVSGDNITLLAAHITIAGK